MPGLAWWQRLGGSAWTKQGYRSGSLCFLQLKQLVSRRSLVGNCASFVLNARLNRLPFLLVWSSLQQTDPDRLFAHVECLFMSFTS